MDIPTKIIPVELSDGTLVKLEARSIGEQRVAFQARPFQEVTNAIKSIASELAITLKQINQTVQPDKVSVKLGLEVAAESGQLTALIVKGAGKANLEITMEWSKQ
ncbi:CU044_2847 family protein [Scytonema sp. NUACC26]|uniref:CU044_2847 family protein n=1 Tax=Scytonema sp. NUACC26 TaxID=3140176 RepID=UPI0034DCBF67